MILNKIFYIIENLINLPTLLTFQTCTLFLKAVLIFIILRYKAQAKNATFLRKLLLIFLVVEFLSNITWILESITIYYSLWHYFNYNYTFSLFVWAFYIPSITALSLFLEFLASQNIIFTRRHKVLVIISIIWSFIFFYCAYLSLCPTTVLCLKLATLYSMVTLSISSYVSLRKAQKNNLPFILKKQLKIFIVYFVAPPIIMDLFVNNLFLPSTIFSLLLPPSNILLATFSLFFTTYMLYFCMTRLMRMRFLNGNDKVTEKNDFISPEKLEYTRLATTIESYKELQEFVNAYFHNVMKVSSEHIMLCIGSYDSVLRQEYKSMDYLKKSTALALFNNIHAVQHSAAFEYLRKTGILVRDELEFTHFYDNHEHYALLLKLLDELEAIIFIPFFEKDKIFGGIIIAPDAQKHRLYSNAEQQQIQSFGSYINKLLIETKYYNLEAQLLALHQRDQELYENNKQLAYSQEVIRDQQLHQCHFGLVFYKDKELTIGWPETEKVLGFPLEQKYHPLCAILKKTAQAAHHHKTIEYAHYSDPHGQELVITAMPIVYHPSTVIIFITARSYSDTMNSLLLRLNNPADWHYVVYLEGTGVGRMINMLLPSNGKVLLNFKVALLKATLTCKPILLQASDEDVQHLVDVIHQASGAQNLEYLTLSQPEKEQEIAEQLFGINPLIMNGKTKGLLEKLNNGIVCIENIHLLSRATQKMLADFIRLGSFKQLYGTRIIQSSVRILCTTHASLEQLVEKGAFDPALAESLLPAKLEIPSLHELSPQECIMLIESYWHQLIKDHANLPFLALTQEDMQHLQEHHYASFTELKKYLASLLRQKIKKNKLEHEIATETDILSEEIGYAVQLGKEALKDEKIMRKLWNKFGNQSKIAQLLGVHRSSVMRRLRDMKIAVGEEEENLDTTPA